MRYNQWIIKWVYSFAQQGEVHDRPMVANAQDCQHVTINRDLLVRSDDCWSLAMSPKFQRLKCFILSFVYDINSNLHVY